MLAMREAMMMVVATGVLLMRFPSVETLGVRIRMIPVTSAVVAVPTHLAMSGKMKAAVAMIVDHLRCIKPEVASLAVVMKSLAVLRT